MNKLQYHSPMEIEKKSFEIIAEELGNRYFPPKEKMVIQRVIHTTADFEYADTLTFHQDAVEKAIAALEKGIGIVTDTSMAAAGINKRILSQFGGKVYCFIGDCDVAQQAKERNITRSMVAMEKACTYSDIGIFVVGNAPTALIRLFELIESKKVSPTLVVGVPVGFVNVIESKNLFRQLNVPSIIAHGRKGGSNVAAAIINALLYLASGDRRD